MLSTGKGNAMQSVTMERRIAPPLSVAALAQTARAWLDPARQWRRALISDIAPRAGDMIFDLDCDDATLPAALAQAGAGVRVVAVADDASLRAAEARAQALGARVEFVRAGALDAIRTPPHAAPNKIVARVCRRVKRSAERINLYSAAAASLPVCGALHVSACTPLQTVDNEPLHEARAMIAEMRGAGFVAVEVTGVFPTPRGSIMLLRGRAS